MGQEIPSSRFSRHDFSAFSARLREETTLLREYLHAGRFSHNSAVGGFELEAWLVDKSGAPSPTNVQFLARLSNPLVVPELALFNVEINGAPRMLRGHALREIQEDLARTWSECRAMALQSGTDLVAIGILPSVRESDLDLAHMSRSQRYRALNEQILTLRQGAPIQLDICGRERLMTRHDDVMLEAATTSFQIHLQVPAENAARFYNAAILVSAPMVAVCANSPYLFGCDLWDETRIPLFEQAVDVGSEGNKRVTFGSDYAHGSLLEFFEENLSRYSVLLPIHTREDPNRFSHLRLHNGTIWRWNRPLIGFDKTGTPHLRIEHRVVPAGPSLVDSLANTAFFFGLTYTLANLADPPEYCLEFVKARANFYAAARDGLRAKILWLHGRPIPVRDLVLDCLVPMATEGLQSLGIDCHDIATYLGIIEARARSGQTGAEWQRQWTRQHGREWGTLCLAYMERQRSGSPVHEWDY